VSQEFTGKVALVTGGGGGIGRATALAFARAGARVAVADIAEAGGRKTAELIQQAGGTAMFIKTDVTIAVQVADMVAQTVAAYGSVDCAFNNAGIEEEHMRLADCPEATFDRVIGINVKGVWLCMKYELAQMLKQGGGAIVNTASIAGLNGAAKMAAYSASKHAVLGLTKSAAVEYARKNIRVNAVCPAVIRTEMYERALAADPSIAPHVVQMHPVGRIGEVEEVAAAVLWLASSAASFVTGFPLAVDGGVTAI
jgi:NAD(P)-dependent dehydrogenase (short-subunit alcohol dehydrogenase family)